MVRVDKYLVDEGYFESRNRASDAIKAGDVTLNGKKAKASMQVDQNTVVEVKQRKFYVSRAGRKLEGFLKEHPTDFQDKNVLDVGSSTGGFAQIVLEKQAKQVTCVDVGTQQLHISLRNNPKVALFENTDIRDFKSDEKFDVITCDVSFISILQIVEAMDRLAQSQTNIIILYKPQFEVGKDVKRDSKGVVQDLDAIERKKELFEDTAKKLGWKEDYQTLSTLTGKSGNQEYLYHFIKN